MTRTPLWIPDMLVVPSYPCALILSRNSQYLLKQFNTIFTSIFACPQKNKKFFSKSDSTTSTFYKPYTHGDLFMCWYIIASPPIKAKYSEIITRSYNVLTYHFTTNFNYLVLYIWRCVFYYLIELETVLSRWYCSISWTRAAKLPWNYFCLCYAPESIAIFWRP